MIIAAIGFLSAGLIMFFVSLPLACRKVPMNALYGVKFAAAYESEQRWYDINAYGGRQMAAWSWLIIAAGVTGFFLPNDAVSLYVPASSIASLLALLIPFVQIIRHLPPQAPISQESASASPESVTASVVTGHRREFIPAIVLVLLCIGYLVFVIESAQWLPPRVATHFGASGRPNGWMQREFYLFFITIFGLVVAGAFAALGLVMSVLYARWKSTGRSILFTSKRNMSYLGSDLIWAACLFLCLIGATHYLTIAANQSHPPQLPSTGFGILIAAYAVGNIAWIILFAVHLMKTAPSK